MIYAVLKTIHTLSIIVWLGGMVFTQFFLRPAMTALETPERVQLMHRVLGRFFNAALTSAGLVLVTGLWMIGRMARQSSLSGVKFDMPVIWTVMATLGLLMVLIFGHIRFALFKKLTRAVTAQDWPAGAVALDRIRTGVSVNLVLGVLIVVVTLLGAAS